MNDMVKTQDFAKAIMHADHASNRKSGSAHYINMADALIAAGYGDVREAAASALRAAAVEAHARGDIGKEDPAGRSVEAFLNWRADKALEVPA